MKQLPLLKKSDLKTPRAFFGGALLKGKRKAQRPLSRKKPIHLVMRSEKATGRGSFLKWQKPLKYILSKHGQKFGVKIYQLAICGNHLHFIIKINDRKNYSRFIAAVAGEVALLISRGAGLKIKAREFWQARPFTRILEWGKDFKRVKNYLTQNTLEAVGFVAYKSRAQTYKKYLTG